MTLGVLLFSLWAPDLVADSDQLCEDLKAVYSDRVTCPQDKDVGMVAFSATSLFNSFYKNGINGNYLESLESVTTNPDEISSDLIDFFNMPAAQAVELQKNITEDAKASLGIDLGSALSTARIRVIVNDKIEGTDRYADVVAA